MFRDGHHHAARGGLDSRLASNAVGLYLTVPGYLLAWPLKYTIELVSDALDLRKF